MNTLNINSTNKKRKSTEQINYSFVKKYKTKFNVDIPLIEYSQSWLDKKFIEIGMNEKTFYNSIGSLGGGIN